MKTWFFEKTSKTCKHLARLRKKKSYSNRRGEKQDITTNSTELPRITRNYTVNNKC